MQAIPYYGQIATYNRNEQSDQDVSQAFQIGDLESLTEAGSPGSGVTNYMIRILRPSYGQIISAYLNVALTFDSTETSPKFYVSAGSGYAADGVTAIVPSSTYIQQAHSQITGQASPLSGQAGQPLTFYRMNLMELIPQTVNNANWSQDSYVVGIHFLKVPVQTGLFHVQKFFVSGSVMVTP
jgi:hypothetical protein